MKVPFGEKNDANLANYIEFSSNLVFCVCVCEPCTRLENGKIYSDGNSMNIYGKIISVHFWHAFENA